MTYTVYSALVDLRSGRVLKTAEHSAADSKTTTYNLGMAEAPPVEPILAQLMTEQAEALLED